MHPYDRYFYNETLGEYTVGTYVADLEARRVYVIVIVIVVVIVIVPACACLCMCMCRCQCVEPVPVPVPVRTGVRGTNNTVAGC